MKNYHHELIFFLTFAGLIVIGAVALWSPLVEHTGGMVFLDVLFTATSAVCVTGLTTIPTSGYNLPGQILIIILMQIGAIGIMTFTASFILFVRGELDFKKRMMAAQLSVSPGLTNIEDVLKTVLKFTIFTEMAGFLLLVIAFHLDGFPLSDTIYYALFHAVSAFCNAGFSPFDASLQDANSMVRIITAILIIMGGIGYYVVFDCLECLKHKDRLTLHTKIVLTATVFCIVFGAGMLSLAEHGQLSLGNAVFQSITARTAGFSTVVVSELEASTVLVLIVLMIIGAGPGSTGGGIKLTTFWVIVSMVYSSIRGREKLVFFDRSLGQKDLLHACILAITYLLFLCGALGLLLYFEKMDFLKTLFEVTSAMGTVGLSMGITAQLGVVGKIILIVTMFFGRIGPAVLVLVLLRAAKVSHLDYPTEKIIIG